MIRVLTFSTLYPNREQPRHGIFVEQRLRHLVQSGKVESRVVAPVPWFPFQGPRWGHYGVLAAVPRLEERFGVEVVHPRYPVIPKVGMRIAPRLMASALAPFLRRMIADGHDFDIIDAHYFYPDGVAAAALGRRFGKPVVITARGSDINVFPRFRAVRRQILWAASRAHTLIAVSEALKEEMIRIGIPSERIEVLRNGVDLTFFHPGDRDRIRADLGIHGTLLLSVGHLIEPKGHHLAINALKNLPNTMLTIVGDGTMKAALEREAARTGVSERVRFTGTLSQAALREYYVAADALVLATRREGMPNVVLESMACGTPVVATAAGGIPELLSVPAAGRLMKDRSAAAVTEAVSDLLSGYPDRAATRRHAERFGWEEAVEGQLRIFSGITGHK